ncbi:aminomethyl-transferring glycine dehydrogenase subunit GcvPA [Armatimonas sp.]|uniref:aminomethyl-transferring glycine dehydrogenase subunit GcvPA n=1 Tax=Armatimonas sp. TaxID=1872638 RepID=UPI003752F43B
MSYIPNTDADRAKMLAAVGASSISALFEHLPQAVRDAADFSELPDALDDISLRRRLLELSGKSVTMDSHPCFLGAGIYDHFIPPTVGFVTGRTEFYTAYTPYQPEVSQGVLQSIYEFQSLVCQLTGMDISNASMYDGATALAEAVIMAADLTKRKKVVLPSSLHPALRQVIETYLDPLGIVITTLAHDAATGQLPVMTDSEAACVVVQSPNFFGVIEDLKAHADAAHAHGALLVASVDPISLGVLEAPGACGVDILVAEGQSLGCYPAFGGPLLGIFCCKKEFIRRIPGRIVGVTKDTDGAKGYVMTLRTREQDIRRDTATSNICTNQALFALAATVYLASFGKTGMQEVAALCLQKAHYAAEQLARLPGYALVYSGPFFKEFLIQCPSDPVELNKKLLAAGILGGLPLPGNQMLICVTEQRIKSEIDQLVACLR